VDHLTNPSEPLQSAVTRRLSRLVGGIPPYSVQAFLVGILCFAVAAVLHIAFRWFGGTLFFVTYFPAVLVAALFAGLPAGLLVILLAALTVWWAVMPPHYEFQWLSRTELMNLGGFLLAGASILFVVELYRSSLLQLRKNERERELVMKELEHRGRNTYAVIDVIIQKTFGDHPELANLASGRIRAVKYANDLLNQTSTHTLLLKSLLVHEFAPYGEGRFHAEGPDVELVPDTARHLALVFHELVTNAAKHGALSKPSGRVLLSWKNTDGTVTLEWREEGGPVVRPPEKHGFGSRIVTQSLKSVSGSITPTFAPGGLHCSITFRA
jgi:two-component sensor histidine kinase